MYYSIIGLIALIILIIENRDTIFVSNRSNKTATFVIYKRFLIAVGAYYLFDILWGIFEFFKLDRLLFINTSFYFIAMAVGVLFWTRCTVSYLQKNNFFGKLLIFTGRIFIAVISVLIVINCFVPIYFTVDENCVYNALGLRYVILILQIILLLMISVNSLYSIEKDRKYRHFALASFGLMMAFFLFMQLFFPYLPLYSIGYMLGTSVLRTFVIGDEKNRIKNIATKDALTGVGNKHAFDEAERQIIEEIENEDVNPFIIVVCDINDLKLINDTKGHLEGDLYIKKAAEGICSTFKNSEIFRVGGDEFIVICRDYDFNHIEDLLKQMSKINAENRQNGEVQVAYGVAKYENGDDVQDVFHRADKRMYEHKVWLKAKTGSIGSEDKHTEEIIDTYQFPENLKRVYESSSLSFVYYQNIDGEAVPVLLSDGFCRNTGMSRETAMEWLKQGLFTHIHPDDVGLVSQISKKFLNRIGEYDIIFRSQAGQTDFDTEIENKDEKYVQIHGIGKWQTMPDGTELAVIAYANLSKTQKAISENTEIYKLLKRDHFYTDPLTGLPNLNYLHEFGNETVTAMRKSGKTPCVIYTDIYSMHSYNDRYGVKEGDKLLCLVADTLKDTFPNSISARAVDDHIVILTDIDDMLEIEKRLTDANKTIKSKASGITSGIRSGVCPMDKKTTLLDAIDRAKHTMKLIANNMNREVSFFSEAANNDYLQERYIIENLNQAIQKGWIKVYYQALYRVETSKIAAFEGLARWVDPDREIINPKDFVPVLQKYHQLHKFDLCVFEQVCKEIKIRHDNNLPLVPVSINFSMQDFDYNDILSEMNKLYEKYDLKKFVDKSYFIIEVTEQDLASDMDRLKEQLAKIRESGYRLWLDDFGSGYSTLNVFSQYHFDLVKFDMDLLKNIDNFNGINRIILKELVFLSRKFGIHTLIEGVETEEQLNFVKEIGCELAQGFYYSKPESLESFLERIRNGAKIKPWESPKERMNYRSKWHE